MLLSLAAGPVPARAAIREAASCHHDDVSAAVAGAAAGDTVTVPEGVCVWDRQLTVHRGVRLLGAGAGATRIEGAIDDRYGTYLVAYVPSDPALDEPFELAGFSFDAGYTSGIFSASSGSPLVALTGLQVHDNRFANGNSRAISLTGLEFGVFYDNLFEDNYIAVSVIGSEMAGWNYPLETGGAAYPFFEDNRFVQSVARGGFIFETGRGGRVVFRHNQIEGYGGSGGEVWDAHGVNGTYPTDTGTVSIEVYGNAVDLSAGSRVLNHRGGRAVVFGNTVTGAGGGINLTEYQGWSYCTADGYPKPQQVNHSYYWANTSLGAPMTPQLYCTSGGCSTCGQYDSTFIQLGRDYWLPAAGPEADRPAGCAVADTFGATDTGRLFECAAADTWIQIYQPYAYPHPLRGGDDSAAPRAPSGLEVR